MLTKRPPRHHAGGMSKPDAQASADLYSACSMIPPGPERCYPYPGWSEAADADRLHRQPGGLPVPPAASVPGDMGISERHGPDGSVVRQPTNLGLAEEYHRLR